MTTIFKEWKKMNINNEGDVEWDCAEYNISWQFTVIKFFPTIDFRIQTSYRYIKNSSSPFRLPRL